MNLENFERVKAAILANPESFHMSWFAAKDDRSPCGTVGCMAGFCDWLTAIDGYKETLFTSSGQLRRGFINDGAELVIRNAKQFLGISDGQADALFHTADWPSKYTQRYFEAVDADSRATVVVRRIDHFLATGE